MTTISHTGVEPDTDKHAALAWCAAEFAPEYNSHLLRRALLVSILTDQYGLTPRQAIEHAMYGCGTRVQEAGREADLLIDQARRAALTAEQDGPVAR